MNAKKLLLASAIAALSTSSFAMESMDDESMSATTGQDGITISLATDLALDMYIHDSDGFTSPSSVGTNYTPINYTNSGALVLQGVKIDNGTNLTDANIGIDIDAGADAASANPSLNIALRLGTAGNPNTRITLGSLRVANSNRTTVSADNANWGITATTGELMNLGAITLGQTTLNLQLGAEPQGAMAWINTTIANGINLSGFSITDASSSATIATSNIYLDNTGAATGLDAKIKVDVVAAGLQVTLDQLGDATNGMDMRVAGVQLGTAPVLGDVEIVGLKLSGTTLTIAGH